MRKADMPMERESLTGTLALVDQVADFIDQIKKNPERKAYLLVPLLSQKHPVYRDRSTGETVRMRGYAMAALERTGTPERALPCLLYTSPSPRD